MKTLIKQFIFIQRKQVCLQAWLEAVRAVISSRPSDQQ